MSETQNKLVDESEGSIQTVCGFDTEIQTINTICVLSVLLFFAIL